MTKMPLYLRKNTSDQSVVKVGPVRIGGPKIAVIAGPCSVESEAQLLLCAEFLKKSGIKIMRASAFKPRTSPYSFQGLGEEGLKLLSKVGHQTGLAVETEVMDVRDVAVAAKYVDVLRVGARNMQNYDLLEEMGKQKKPVILKNGLAATMDEFLNAAEYILKEGNPNVILCLRGIRTFETKTRFSFDPGLIPALKHETHLPVIVDPSHPAGKREFVPAIARAAIAAGADGLLIEVHPNPVLALSDNDQQLDFPEFEKLLGELKRVTIAVGRQ
ncbi:MAG: 3-deoxy-7-phosphoheptulonate synthase [Candidatus Diapherotrites archaeon]|uniref:3-deoxy-7-phosphoheptulonate synthase n=1 Tax=Candidatus Iainarchaeum sp. TaxID=3101447 RepID=A0A8T4L799_9ARCH|nr:3-deoxy-7-phosphoheptulonate synthase [Candidatus Diapherotrites archaeon]